MVVAASTTPNLKATPSLRSQSNPRRPPLLLSEKESNVSAVAPTNNRRPKSREVSSRYLSSTSSLSSTSGSSSSTLSNSSFLSSSRRCPSPIPARTPVPATPATNSSVVKRPQSAERRRPATPSTMTNAAKMLMSSTATRSLSVSFQGESFAVTTSKKNPRTAPSPNLRKGTPERRKTSSATPAAASPTPKKGENARPIDHQPWPGRSRPMPASMFRSLDLGCDGRKLVNGSSKVVRALRVSLIGEANKTSSDEKLRRSLSRSETVKWVRNAHDSSSNCVNSSSLGSESLISDTESVSSECNSGSQDSSSKGGGGKGRSIVAPPRVWPDANTRLKRASEPASPVARHTSLKGMVPPKLTVPKKAMSDSPGTSPRSAVNGRGFSSPLRSTVRPASPSKMKTSTPSGLVRPASPSKMKTSTPSVSVSPASPNNLRTSTPSGSMRPASPSKMRTSTPSGSVRPASPSKLRPSTPSEKSSPFRGMASPSRVRSGTTGALANTMPTTPSVLCFGADVRRTKVGDNRLGDAHLLRLLHNRHLQWRFVNARTEASLSIQQTNAETSLYNAWRQMSDLRWAVSYKRRELQWLRQKLKLHSVLKDQMQYLEEWALMDEDHCSSLLSATESLKASVIRLPIVGGARADIHDVKDAICSAADVMQSMGSSICSLLAKVEAVNSLMAEVASLASKEHNLLNECKEILSALTAMQVKDYSLRAHILQLKRAPSSLTVGA